MLIDEIIREVNCKNPSIIDCKKLGYEMNFIWGTYYSKIGEKSWKKTFDFLLDFRIPSTRRLFVVSKRKQPVDVQSMYEENRH